MGYVLTGILAFILGVLLTLFAVKLHDLNRDRKGE